MLRPDGHPVVAAMLDVAMAPLDRLRRKLVPQARGQVLEIGFGTGLNLAHYVPHQVEHLTAIEPDPYMRERAAGRVATAPVSLELLDAGAEALPFGEGVFDTVVATWVLCTVPDPARAVAEIHRVLRPGGRLLFAEHTLSPRAVPASVQRVLTPCWRQVAGGCCLDRDSVGLIRSVFDEVHVLPNPREAYHLAPVYVGHAVR